MLLHNQLSNHNIILASNSPRRHELMTQADIRFSPAPKYEVDEQFPPEMSSYEVPIFLAHKKSDAYPVQLSEADILITADTVVIANGRVIGKPTDAQNAAAMIGSLSGIVHEVVTGVVVRTIAQTIAFDAISKVWFRELTVEEIAYYVAKYSPMDKAGAYGIQEWIGCVAIEKIEGSFYNVMGLPIQKLYHELKKLMQ